MPESERHSLFRWMEIEGVPQPAQAIRLMKGYGIWRKGRMVYGDYRNIHTAMVERMITTDRKVKL